MSVWLLSVVLLVLCAALLLYVRRKPITESAPPNTYIGDITIETLRFYCGLDFFRPTLIAVQGRVYDVTSSPELYGPGKPNHAYAGHEIARALAKNSLLESDMNGRIEDLVADEVERLQQVTAELSSKYDVVGKIVPMKELSLAELAEHNGTDPSKPIYLAIKGKVFDVTSGKSFYGPNGMYPFAGYECARAFALLSTDIKDCNDDLEGLGRWELQTLEEWDQKFQYKYPIIGVVVKSETLDASDS